MALDPNMSRWVNLIVLDELAKCSDSMNLNGSDRKVFELCSKDFNDYLTFMDTLMEVEPLEPDMILNGEVIGSVIAISINPYALTLIKGQTNTQEVVEFIHMWVQWWWRKYQLRVKVVFDFPKENPVVTRSTLEQFTNEELNDIIVNTRNTLIKYGEICCSQILADNLFKHAVQKCQKTKWTTNDKINLITELNREAKRVAYTHGPIIFIRPDKNFLRLREYRDDNNSLMG